MLIFDFAGLRSPTMLTWSEENQAHCGVYLWVCGHYGEEVGSSEEAGFNLTGIQQ